MAGFAIELNNTFQNTFTNVLDDKFNNLKDIHVNNQLRKVLSHFQQANGMLL